MSRPIVSALGIYAILLVVSSYAAAAEPPVTLRTTPQTVRCAVVGGLNEINFWPELADRFHRGSGHRAEIVATGPKHGLTAAFKAGDADVILMHASDAAINLVADGYGENLQPWARNDYVIVGPAADPAKIKGEKDAAIALAKIIATKSKLLVHASSGVSELLSDLLAAGELELDPGSTLSVPSERHRQMLRRAADEQAYTLVGRIPFLNGKLDAGGLSIMVQGDERLRRPYVVVVAADQPNDSRLAAARQFASFLRERETQAWIASFGVGRFDQQSLLFPVRTKR